MATQTLTVDRASATVVKGPGRLVAEAGRGQVRASETLFAGV